ncbi:ribosomal small subunit pseudouridine synthase A [Marinobacter sp. EVN1]|jgi:ribosomal small subunit pseudouridine synthase A (EC 5.4.99.-)|uniref:pseudouridine synthase n=1 Tax=Marinobacter sp. EVN1 TaxID=1397532 RepID=UPI0003B7FEA5|nr:pseudouridine synthase [Marinobacter sp. EVN1]ERS84547.1 ribosomal small subunit pseudouridine synthase A [Marinobacter sp. EVN1]
MKLSRIVSNQNGVSRRQANQLLAAGRIRVDDSVCLDGQQEVTRFQQVCIDDTVIQQAAPAYYLMLNKPHGYLSATVDDQHPTVMELIEPELRPHLHIGGRLDRASTGLLILSSDGVWSRRLTEPAVKIPKVYRVTTAYAISPETEDRFREGIWFEYEQLRTSPASLEPLGEREVRLTIYEGRYHQVKRMFHAVGNRVTSLHRESMGGLTVDGLEPGSYRHLSAQEVSSIG